jgi:hypothetical protein
MSGVCDPSGDALTFPVGAASTPPTATAASRAKLKRSSATGSPPAAAGGERTFIATKVYGEMGAEPGSWLSGLDAYPARGQRTDHRSANS